MVATQIVSLGAALALAMPAAASPAYADVNVRAFNFPDFVPHDKRQVSPGQFQCHSNCGNTITGSETSGYCTDSSWRSLLDACLECVVEYPIWQWYGEGVGQAAAGCDLTAEPGTPSGPIGGSEPSPEPQPEPQPEPTPEPQPEPQPEPAPESSAEVAPEQPSAAPAPQPTPEESGKPAPAPVPVPSAAPTSEATPEESGEATPSGEGEYEQPSASSVAASSAAASHSAYPIPSHVPTPSGNQTAPLPTHVETNGAARLAGAGSIVGAGLVALFML